MKLNALKKSFEGFDPNNLDLSEAGDWPIGPKVVACFLLVVVIGVLGYQFYITDKVNALNVEIRQEDDLKRNYTVKAFQVANLDALSKQMQDVEERFAELLRQLPTAKEVPGLLDDITNLGRNSGLEIIDIGLRPERKNQFYIELPIEIKVSGSYHQLGEFVSGVAAIKRIVTLHDYEIKPNANRSGALTMNISAKTYRYDDTD